MRQTCATFLILLTASTACHALDVELRQVTPQVYKDAAIAAERLMDKLDVNLDGFADMRDAEDVIARGIGNAEQLAVQGAMRNDLDGDGRITPEEVEAFARRNFGFLAGTEERIPGRNENFAEYLAHQMTDFANWDLDKDGIVTRKEVETFLTSENPRRASSVRREYQTHLRTMDSDGDGRISIAEMTRAFARASTYPVQNPVKSQPSRGVGLRNEQFVSIQATTILKEFEAGPTETVTYKQAVLKGGENCYLLSMDEERDGIITRAKIERRARAAAEVADIDKDGLLSQTEMMDAWLMLHGMKTWRLPNAPAAD